VVARSYPNGGGVEERLRGVAMTRSPNLLLLVSDQYRADVTGCAVHPVVRTPHLDRPPTTPTSRSSTTRSGGSSARRPHPALFSAAR
jgi:hypothetical protein